MATNYPGNLDNLTNPAASDSMADVSHAAQHANANDAIEAIETELGVDPSGSAATVKARLDGIEDGSRIGSKVITAAKIADDTITATQIAANAIGASELADNAVDTAAIADGAVTSAKIADGTIVNADVSASAAIAPAKIDGTALVASTVDAKGDLLVGTADNTVARLAVGTDGQILQADSTATAGVKWAPLGNLLTANQASVESDTSGFNPTGCTLAASTDQALHGASSLKVTSSAAGTIRVGVAGPYTGPGTIPVTPGQVYTFSVYLRAPVITNPTTDIIYWWKANGTAASTASSSITGPALSNAWVKHTVIASAPADAAYASLNFRWTAAAADVVIYADCFTFHRGQSGAWGMPGSSVTGQAEYGNITALTATATLSGASSVITADTTSGAITLTLPPAALAGRMLRIVKTGGANTLTLIRAGSDTIVPSSGSRTSVAFPSGATHGEMMFVSDGSAWYAISGQASDETVGRRLWKWEQALGATSTTAATGWQMIYADTGWRDISANLLNGWTSSGGMFLRRVNERITLRSLNGSGASATSTTLYTLDGAFRPGSTFFDVQSQNGSATVSAFQVSATSGNVIIGDYASHTDLRLNKTWTTSLGWPSSLPGSAYGSIPS